MGTKMKNNIKTIKLSEDSIDDAKAWIIMAEEFCNPEFVS